MRLLPFLLLIGCAPITRIGDKIIGLTDPVLVGGMVLGVQPPEDEQLAIALQASGVFDSTQVRLVTADALELRDIDSALLTDALLQLETPETYPLSVAEDGWYGLDGPDTPSYIPGRTWTLSAELSDRIAPGTVAVPLPDTALLDFDPEHAAKTDLVIPLDGQGFDFVFATVYDHLGTELWTNAPTTNDAIIDFVLPGGDPVEEVVIPADAFPEESLYIVGVAGLERAPIEGIEGLNEALTAVLAGRIGLQPVVGGSRIALSGLYLGVEPVPAPLAPLLASAGFDPSATLELFLVDLLDMGAGVGGAVASLDGVAIPEIEPAGHYHLDGLDYAPGQLPRVEIESDLTTASLVFQPELPGPVDATLPNESVAGSPVEVSLPGGPWAAGLGVVIGPSGLTWSNLPVQPEEWAALLSGEGSVDGLTLPASAFASPGTYAVGVVALDSQPLALVGANPAFSTAMAGQFRFQPLSIVP